MLHDILSRKGALGGAAAVGLFGVFDPASPWSRAAWYRVVEVVDGACWAVIGLLGRAPFLTQPQWWKLDLCERPERAVAIVGVAGFLGERVLRDDYKVWGYPGKRGLYIFSVIVALQEIFPQPVWNSVTTALRMLSDGRQRWLFSEPLLRGIVSVGIAAAAIFRGWPPRRWRFGGGHQLGSQQIPVGRGQPTTQMSQEELRQRRLERFG
mmetsp:Transcript_67725/g.180321  ORF Transcript_67725/g.180321 Transcript_67725/m.180321 type:complete len:209 (-) Transcript_67725:38-664(-)